MTIRSLAAEAGVAPMSLYQHIRDKDDLLDEVTDRLLAGAWPPSAAEDDWQAWVAEAAARLRALLVSQPATLQSTSATRRLPRSDPADGHHHGRAAADRRRRIGRPARLRGLHTYTIDFAALEASRARPTPGTPEASSLARQLAAYTTAEHVMNGLRYLLEGIGRHLAPDPEPGQ